MHALAHTDLDGRARLAVPALPGAHVVVHAEGFGEALALATPGLDDPRAPLVVRLARAARLGVEVVDPAGAPVADRTVRLSVEVGPLAGGHRLLGTGRRWSARTDEHGRCTFTELPAQVALRAELGGERGAAARRESVRLASGEEREVRWQAGGAARVVGVAREASGAPAAGVELALVAARCRSCALHGPIPRSARPRLITDAKGRFAFEGVAPGTWAVGPLLPALDDSSAPAPYGPAVEVPAGAGEVAVELAVHRGGFVRGLVLDASGAAADGAQATAIDLDRGVRAPAVRASAGRFRLGPLPPGTYRVRAQGRGLAGFSAWHEARPGDPELVLRLAPAGELRGRALDLRTGAPLPGVLVRAVPVDGLEGGTFGSMRTTDAGLFRLRPGRAGTFDVVAVDEAGERVAVAPGVVVPAGASAAELELRLGRAARVSVRNGDAAAPVRVRVRAAGACLRAREILAAGAALDVLVPPGTVEVDVLDGWPTERVARTLEADARPGAPATVVVPR